MLIFVNAEITDCVIEFRKIIAVKSVELHIAVFVGCQNQFGVPDLMNQLMQSFCRRPGCQIVMEQSPTAIVLIPVGVVAGIGITVYRIPVYHSIHSRMGEPKSTEHFRNIRLQRFIFRRVSEGRNGNFGNLRRGAAIENAKKQFFRTDAGLRLLNGIYLRGRTVLKSSNQTEIREAFSRQADGFDSYRMNFSNREYLSSAV